MSSEAQGILINLGVLIVALIPLTILYGLALRDMSRAEQRAHQLERVVDQCAEIIKPAAAQSREFADLVGGTLTRHQRKQDDDLQAAARAIDVVRGADHGR